MTKGAIASSRRSGRSRAAGKRLGERLALSGATHGSRSSAEWAALALRRAKRLLALVENSRLASAKVSPGGLVRGNGTSKSPRPSAPHERSLTLTLQLVGTARMAALNAQYRGKPYATDVLSFPAPEPFRKEGHLGELVICLSTLKKQAREQAHPPEVELDVLLVHGVLHLLGHDHEKGSRQAAAMARQEAALLKSLGRSTGLIDRTK